MKRNASAVRSGGLRDGNGMHTNRNPREAIAASHAGCLSMALSAQRGEGGLKAERIATTAMVTLEKSGEGFSISAVRRPLRAASSAAATPATPAPITITS